MIIHLFQTCCIQSDEKDKIYALATILFAKLKILDFSNKIRKFALVRYGAVFSNRGAVFSRCGRCGN